jgi:hypothetical protein
MRNLHLHLKNWKGTLRDSLVPNKSPSPQVWPRSQRRSSNDLNGTVCNPTCIHTGWSAYLPNTGSSCTFSSQCMRVRRANFQKKKSYHRHIHQCSQFYSVKGYSRYPTEFKRASVHMMDLSPRTVVGRNGSSPLTITPMEVQDGNVTPVTPPISTARKVHPLALSLQPNAPKYQRPINRRLYLQEAQERLSLPDLFASPKSPTLSSTMRRTRAVNSQLLLAMQQQQSQSSFRIRPKAVPWGDYWDNASHNKSQRSINPNDAIWYLIVIPMRMNLSLDKISGAQLHTLYIPGKSKRD